MTRTAILRKQRADKAAGVRRGGAEAGGVDKGKVRKEVVARKEREKGEEEKIEGDETPGAKGTWDVANPPGPFYEIAIDTDEGTWMSVDVSPDGEVIVFDLLGDIYAMPMTGGEARQLTEGIPWDEQPRFSPDGRHIAFTSDRDGNDEIYIINVDGTDARNLTQNPARDFRPAWSPVP